MSTPGSGPSTRTISVASSSSLRRPFLIVLKTVRTLSRCAQGLRALAERRAQSHGPGAVLGKSAAHAASSAREHGKHVWRTSLIGLEHFKDAVDDAIRKTGRSHAHSG